MLFHVVSCCLRPFLNVPFVISCCFRAFLLFFWPGPAGPSLDLPQLASIGLGLACTSRDSTGLRTGTGGAPAPGGVFPARAGNLGHAQTGLGLLRPKPGLSAFRVSALVALKRQRGRIRNFCCCLAAMSKITPRPPNLPVWRPGFLPTTYNRIVWQGQPPGGSFQSSESSRLVGLLQRRHTS